MSASWAFFVLGLMVVQPPKYALFFKLLSLLCPDLVRLLKEERDIARDGDAKPEVGVAEFLFPSSRGIVDDLAMVYLSENGLPKMSASS